MYFFSTLHAKALEKSELGQLSDGFLHQNVAESLCPKGTVILCGELSAATGDIYGWAAQHQAQLLTVEEDAITQSGLAEVAERVDFLIVDADFMGDVEDTVDFCLRVRRGIPGLKIILISSEVRGHDLTCERMAACDVTLRAPVTKQCLDLGARVARENHRKFARATPAHAN